MPAWTKADFDGAYTFRPERYLGGRDPAISAAPVILHYHKFAMKPLLAARWALLAPVLNIDASDHVLIVGAGFGWGVEAFIAETGATAIGIDVSQYVADELSNTETAELRSAITAAGLDPDTGRGAELLAALDDGQPRANVIVLQQDAQTNTSRQAIRSALGNNWPSVCIVEELNDDSTTDAEITQINNALTLFGGSQRVIWVSDDTVAHTLQQLQTLTGAEVISTDGRVHLGA